MKIIILLITLAVSTNVMSSDFKITLDKKHYENAITVVIAPKYDDAGFNEEGLHQDTGTTFSPQGINKEGERDCNGTNTYFSKDYYNRHYQDYTTFTTRNGTFKVNGRMKTNLKNPNKLDDPYYYYPYTFTFQGRVGSDLHYRASTCRKLSLD